MLGQAYERMPTPSAPILFHLFPCQSWSAPPDPLETCRSPLPARMIWAGSVHSSNCNSSTDSSKNSSQSRGQWWQTGSRGNRQNKTGMRGGGMWENPRNQVCTHVPPETWRHRSSPCRPHIHPHPYSMQELFSFLGNKFHTVLPNKLNPKEMTCSQSNDIWHILLYS